MPLKMWLKVWLEEYTSSVKPGTAITYESNVRLHIVPALGAMKLSEIRTHDIQSFINNLHRGSKALSPKMVKNIHGTLHKALDVAAKIEYLRGNPANNIELPRIEREEIKPLAGDQIDAFTQKIKGTPCEALFYTALYSGMRLSELLGLQWRCVDFDTGTIRIDKQLLMKRGKGTERELGPTKNGKTRTIKVAPAVINVLKSVKMKQTEDRLKAGPLWINEMSLVFTDELGKCIPHATVEHRFKRIVSSIGLSDRRPHDLRHTYATESIRLGVPIKTVSDALGHYSTAFTMDVYAHVTPEMQDDAAARMQAEIDRRKSQLS
jgi:integrase